MLSYRSTVTNMSILHSENMIMGGKTVVKLEDGTDSIKIPKTKII